MMLELTRCHSASVRSIPVNTHTRPDAFGRFLPDVPPRPIDLACFATSLKLLTGRAGAHATSARGMSSPNAPAASDPASNCASCHPVTPFRLRFFASGAVENRRFASTKASNLASQARQEGERNPNPSLPLKHHRLCKCANITKCTSPCACVLAFSQSFLRQ
jgi:hypothetical protein